MTVKLDAEISYYEASPGEIEFVTNGCGSAHAKFDFVPDTIYFMSITPACRIHDWDYHIFHTIEEKGKADRRFLNNMLRLIEEGSKWLRMLRRRRALKYFEAVNAWGGPAFWLNTNE